jgi:energy-coupling factor transporter transmembrane protein EcfT
MAPWVASWMVLAMIALYRHWRHGWGVGLLLTYIFCFAALHWLAPVLHLLPWFEPERGDLTAPGMRESTFAMAAFVVGAELPRFGRSKAAGFAYDAEAEAQRIRQLINLFFVVGIVLYVVALFGGQLPFLSSIVSTGSTVVAVSVGLKCWEAWREGHMLRLWTWFAVAVLFPVISVVTQGFLGYGFIASLIVFAFVVSVQPRRWWMPFAAAALVFLGLSVYVTYMRDRSDIRDVVWGGEQVGARVAQLQTTFSEAEWFDPADLDHIERIDRRLNQNQLLGAAVTFIGEGSVPYAGGTTLTDAIIALIPRALWPDKPNTAGSGDIVATYTGIRFAYGTSVGVGQVMELFINFGTPGVVIGFVVLGALVAGLDRRAARHLEHGDVTAFMMTYIPSLSLLQVGGSFAEVTGTAAASALLVALVNRLKRPDSMPAVVPSTRVTVAPPREFLR